MSVSEILKELEEALKATGSPLSDFSPQSVTHTLLRAFAVTLNQRELLSRSLDANTDFLTASGSNLDRLCAPFALTRKQANRSSGFALVSSTSDTELLAQTIAVEPNSGSQFLVSSSSSILLKANVETVVPLTSAGIGNTYDLAAGTTLQFPALTGIFAVVGYERKFDGTACGNLSGGSLAESDRSLRERFFSLMRAGGTLSTEALRAYIIERSNVIDAKVITTAPGIVWVIVRTLDPQIELLEEIRTELKNYLIGSLIKIDLANPLPLSIELNLSIDNETNLDSMRGLLKEDTEAYIREARQSGAFDPKALEARLQDRGNVSVNTPSKQLTFGALDFIELGDLQIAVRI